MPAPENTCETCAYFNASEYERVPFGACHRFPPEFEYTTALGKSKEQQAKAKFPTVAPTDWCGEHKLTQQ